MRRLAFVGLALTLAGLGLAVGFWPLFSVSGADLLASRNVNPPAYYGYSPGGRITIHERVLDVSVFNFFGSQVTSLELDDSSAQQTTLVYVQGDASGVVKAGDVIFASAVLRFVPSANFYYWEIATPGDVHPSWPVDAVFYATMAVGVAVLAYAALRRP